MTSHRHENLSLSPIMAAVEGSRVSVTVTSRPDGSLWGSMKVTKYLSRSRRDLSFFEFLVGGFNAKRQSKSSKKGKPGSNKSLCYDEAEEDEEDGSDEDNANDDHVNDDDFDEPDPVATTERLSIGCPSLPTDFVVVLHGFSFKPKVRLNTKEKRERNALAVLLCFVPFDSLEKLHILQGCESYTEAAEKADICPLGIKYLKNVELLWTDKMKAQERTKTHNQALLTEAERTEGLQGLSFCKKTMNSLDSDDDFNSDSDNDLDTRWYAHIKFSFNVFAWWCL